jgi:hypothetical protein
MKGLGNMGEKERFEISIPCDSEGFVLLQCPLCGDLFKLKPCDFQDDSVFEIHCPACGLVSDNYVTEDVIELAKTMMGNFLEDLITQKFKKLERNTKNSLVKFKATSNSKKEKEHPIKLSVEALEAIEYSCCKKEAKIKPILRMCGFYCTYCGVKNYGTE